MTSMKPELKSTMVDITGKSWAELCDSSQSLPDADSPSKKVESGASAKYDENELYDLVFQPVKKELVNKVAAQDDLSLTSFMSNVHMVTPVKQEIDTPSSAIIDEDTICSPFVKCEPKDFTIGSSDTDVKSTVNNKIEIQHAKRRLTSECGSMVSESDPTTPERINKVNKKSTYHRNIHDSVESPKYVYILIKF